VFEFPFRGGSPNGDIKFRGLERVGMSSIDLPAGVLDAIAAPPADREPIVRQELAVSLYREEYLSFGKARELAGLSKAEFHRLLGEREIERHYTAEDLALDLEYARE
jgi:predicted HTH domain antitoxin